LHRLAWELYATENSILAPRIHGELLKLGFEVAQSRVAKYMVKLPNQNVCLAYLLIFMLV
jgi:hypothetical protein